MGLIGRIIALITLLIVPASAWAVHPFQVESAEPQGKGNVLLELNDDYSQNGSDKKNEQTGILTVGIGEITDIAIKIPYLELDPSPVTGSSASGMGDVRINFKQRFYSNEVKQSMAYQLYVNTATGEGEKGLGTNNIIWGLALLDQQVCHNNILHASLTYEVYGRALANWHFAQDFAFLYGLAAEFKMTGKFWLLTEIAGEMRKNTDGASGVQTYVRPWTFMAGFKYDITKSWYADLAARAGLNDDAEDYTALAGVAWKF
jgi:opacity protein-like surface antigen